MRGACDQWVWCLGVGLFFPDAVVPQPARSTKGTINRSFRKDVNSGRQEVNERARTRHAAACSSTNRTPDRVDVGVYHGPAIRFGGRESGLARPSTMGQRRGSFL